MTFTYPAVFTKKEEGDGYHAFFPDLEMCEADGADLEDAIENARDAAQNWIWRNLRVTCPLRPIWTILNWRRIRLQSRSWLRLSFCRTATDGRNLFQTAIPFPVFMTKDI
mgnify:CR=1 FL=1